MPARAFDWRDDPMGTVLAVPEVRARFIRTEPGVPPGNFHSHEESDGVEVWVVLEGAVCFEIEEEIEKLARAGQEITRISLVGYSLGGLVARFCVGLLDSKGFFEKIKPVVCQS